LAEEKMKVKNINKCGFALIELLVILGIVLIILRYVYAQEMYEWENAIVSSLGMNPVIYRIAFGILWVCILVGAAIREIVKRRKAKQRRFLSFK
jgi:hypothetical protein